MLKNQISKFLAIAAFAFAPVAITSCSDSDEPKSYEERGSSISIGDEVVSQLRIDGKVYEEMVDDVVNYGTDDDPIVFYVNKSHQVNGRDVPQGPSDLNCTFVSITRDELESYIKIFAVARGIAQSENLTDEQKRKAFRALHDFIMSSDIELAMLVYLSKNDPDQTRAMINMLSSVNPFTNGKSQTNSLLRTMFNVNITPLELQSQLDENGLTLGKWMSMADRQGINLGQQIETRGFLHTMKTVVKGAVLVSKLIIAFVENAKPCVNFESNYASLLNEMDIEPLNYYNSTKSASPEYEVWHGAYGAPLAYCRWKVDVYYNAIHDDIMAGFSVDDGDARYVTRIGVTPIEVKCTAFQHVEADITFGLAELVKDGATNYFLPINGNEVNVRYGDSCCFNKHACLKFTVGGTFGYEENMFDF